MAQINLLAGKYTGKIGETIGTNYKGRAIVKGITQRIRKPAEVNKNSFSAFSKLNRIASVMAKHYWKEFRLQQGNMLKHNKIASFLKPSLVNHTWTPTQLELVFNRDGTASISNLTYERSGGLLSFNVTTTLDVSQPSGNILFTIVCDDDAYVYFTRRQLVSTESYGVHIVVPRDTNIHVMTFTIYNLNGATTYGGFYHRDVPALPIVESELLYTSRMLGVDALFVSPERVILSGNIHMKNGRIRYPKT